MVDVGKLQVFLVAAETENFSAAARRLGLSQPAISFQIQSLEAELKVRLFERVGKRVALTAAGRELLPMAHDLINLATSIEETVGARHAKRTVNGQLRIGCGTSLAKHVLPHLIGAYCRRYPLVRVSCELMSHQAIGEKLVKREIHLGVVSQPFKSRKLDFDPLFTDELVLVVAASHPWVTRAQVSLAELRLQNWILSDTDLAADPLLAASLTTQGIPLEELHSGMRLGDAESVLAAVEAEQGVAFVFHLAARRSLELGRVKIMRVQGISPTRCETCLVYYRQHDRPAAQRCFQEFVASDEGQRLIAEQSAYAKEG